MNDKVYRPNWIESFVFRNKGDLKFSTLTNVFTIIICSLLLIVSAKIKVNLYPVPMTLQPLAILMIAMLCGRNIAVGSVGLYLFQGMIGLPVFAYGGGLPYLMGPTGGFLFGFLIASIVLGELADRGWGKLFLKSILAMLIGMLIIYSFGILQLSLLKGFSFALLKGFSPFIIGDLYKVILAALLLPQIWKLTKDK